MSRSKKIFLASALAFFLFLFYAAYDIGTRTTFPGAGPPEKEAPENSTPSRDSISYDSGKSEKGGR